MDKIEIKMLRRDVEKNEYLKKKKRITKLIKYNFLIPKRGKFRTTNVHIPQDVIELQPIKQTILDILQTENSAKSHTLSGTKLCRRPG